MNFSVEVLINIVFKKGKLSQKCFAVTWLTESLPLSNHIPEFTVAQKLLQACLRKHTQFFHFLVLSK